VAPRYLDTTNGAGRKAGFQLVQDLSGKEVTEANKDEEECVFWFIPNLLLENVAINLGQRNYSWRVLRHLLVCRRARGSLAR
jgi:hypothetical protein